MSTESNDQRAPSREGPDRSPPVLYDQRDHVVTISYNRPERKNAIDGNMREHLNDAWLRFRDDPDAWVAILTATGSAFCAGADLRDGAGATGAFAGTYWEKPTINSFESGLELFKPVIAAINGPCIGYGLTAVTFADFVIASERATFGYPEVTIGVPTIVGAIRLPERIGWQNAMELLLLGDTVDAERARELGLVWKVVAHDALADEAHLLADRLCAVAPLAQRATKEVATRTRSMSWVEAVRFGETMRLVATGTEDAREGRSAFAERRRPQWTGR